MEKKSRNDIIYEFFKIATYKFITFDLMGSAAQIGFYLLLSLLPLLLFVVSLLPLFNIDEQTVYNAIDYVFNNQQIELYVKQIINSFLTNESNTALSISIIFALYSASSLISTILKVVDRLYNEKKTRNFLVTRFKAFYLTLFFILLLFTLVATYTLTTSIVTNLLSNWTILLLILNIVKYLILPFFIFIFLITMYIIGSNQKYKYYTYVPGAIFAIATGYISTSVFNFYIISFSTYDIKYGAIGILIISLLWLLLISAVILIGALVNSIFTTYLINNNHDIRKIKNRQKNKNVSN